MNTLVQWFTQLYIGLAAVPFLVFAVVWAIRYYMTRDKRMATRTAMDFTVLFLIGSVSVLLENIVGSSFGMWLIVLLFLIAAGLLGNLQTRMKGVIDYLKIAKVLLRVGFMFLSVCYVLLLIIGVGKYLYIS